MAFEYKTVGGPERGKRKRGCKTASERVAAAMEELIRAEAADGWEYVRTDLVPVEERTSWLGRRQTLHCAVLVFRRETGGGAQSRAALSRKAARIFAQAEGDGAAAEPPVRAPRMPAPGRHPLPRVPQDETTFAPLQRDPGPQAMVPPAAGQEARPRPPTPEQLQAAVMAGHPAYASGIASGLGGASMPLPPAGKPEDTGDRPAATGLFTRMRGAPPVPETPRAPDRED